MAVSASRTHRASWTEDTRWSYACAAADYDLDGDQDLYVANDYGVNALWRNDGGEFTDVAGAAASTTSATAWARRWGDLDNDGAARSLRRQHVVDRRAIASSGACRRRGAAKDLLKMAAGNSIFLAPATARTFERLPSTHGGIDASWAWAPALADSTSTAGSTSSAANGFMTGDTAADT